MQPVEGEATVVYVPVYSGHAYSHRQVLRDFTAVPSLKMRSQYNARRWVAVDVRGYTVMDDGSLWCKHGLVSGYPFLPTAYKLEVLAYIAAAALVGWALSFA